MSAIDDFASSLLEEAKRFLEKAESVTDEPALNAYLHAAIMLGFCSLEAHVNAIADDFATRPEMTPHERGILLEREVRLEGGEFSLSNTLRMFRLEDRISFLHKRISGQPLDRSAAWWAALNSSIKTRNDLTHPKEVSVVTVESVKRAIQAIIDTLDALYQGIYRRKLPAHGYGLHSQLDF